MTNINGNFTQKTFDPNKTTIKVDPGGGEIIMLFKYIIDIINEYSEDFLKLESNLSSTLQTIKDSAGTDSSMQIGTENVVFTTPAAFPFKIKGKDISGAQFDIEAFAQTGDEYLGLRMRGVLAEYLSQLYYFRSAATQDYLAIQNNLTDMVYFINESGIVETLFSNGKLGIGVAKNGTTGSSNIATSAKVQIDSTTQGVLLPRMTTTQINAIASPIAGLEVYNTTLNTKCFYNGTSWQKVTTTAM